MLTPQPSADELALAEKVIDSLRERGKTEFTDAEFEILRSVALMLIALRAAGKVVRSFLHILKWAGWVILILLALKNGLPLSQIASIWPHV